jgi:CRP-like cAMP-binding protein
MIKKLFGKRSAESAASALTIEDLIVLERWDEAIGQLEARVERNPKDLHAHLKLAEVCVQSGKSARAVDRYLFVADSYVDDGFYDKAIALLTKIARIAPGDGAIEESLRRAQQLKTLEHRRTLAIAGLLESQKEQAALSRISLVEAQKIWSALASTDVVLRLPGEQLQRLFQHSALVQVAHGAVLVERGSGDEALWLVIRGEIEALIDVGDGRPIQVRVFAVGDIIGDRALFEHHPWPATYRAVSDAELFRLDSAGLAKALEGNPDPRGLLDALRARRHDHDVAAAVRKLVSSSV